MRRVLHVCVRACVRVHVCVHRIHALPHPYPRYADDSHAWKEFLSLAPFLPRSISHDTPSCCFSFFISFPFAFVDLHLLPVVDSDAEPEAYLGTGNQYREKFGLPRRMHLPISQAGNHGARKRRIISLDLFHPLKHLEDSILERGNQSSIRDQLAINRDQI